jgi:hypothetical protein
VNREDQKRAEENPGDFVARREREQALIPLLNALHELDVRINGLNRDMCHCGLVAEVALNALNLGQRREAAYRAGREDAARDLRKIAVSSDKGNILRDLLDFAADVTEGKYTAAQVSLAAKVAAGNRTDDLVGDGVQPTEEQRARNEDQKRDEEMEHG